MRILLTLSILLFPLFSHAEYRVFLLKIAKRAAPAADQSYRLVESTLDPLQYVGYHPVPADEYVSYIDTWRCRGNTSNFKPHCPNPKGQIPSPQPEEG